MNVSWKYSFDVTASLETTTGQYYSPRDLILVNGERRSIPLVKNKNKKEGKRAAHVLKYLYQIIKVNADCMRLLEETYPGGNVFALRFELFRNLETSRGEPVPESAVWDFVDKFFKRLERLALRDPGVDAKRLHRKDFPLFGTFAYGYVKEEKVLHGNNHPHCHCFILVPAGLLQEVKVAELCRHLQDLWEDVTAGYCHMDFPNQRLIAGKGDSRYFRQYSATKGPCWRIFPTAAYHEENADFEDWLSRLTYFCKTWQKNFQGKKLFTKLVESPYRFKADLGMCRPCLVGEVDDFYYIRPEEIEEVLRNVTDLECPF